MTHVPVKGQPFTVSMGLRTMAADQWIEIDEHFETELAQKRQLLQTRRAEVFGALPQGFVASAEVLAKLVDYVPERFPDRFSAPIEITIEPQATLTITTPATTTAAV